jgi:hypothetical protein
MKPPYQRQSRRIPAFASLSAEPVFLPIFVPMDMNNLRNITNYARLCGVTKQAIVGRIDRQILECVEVNGVRFIDIIRFPPSKGKPGPRKQLPTPRLPPTPESLLETCRVSVRLGSFVAASIGRGITLRQLSELPLSFYLKQRNFGKKTFAELNALLVEAGLDTIEKHEKNPE